MKANSAEEVLGVAAHEMAHVTQRHVAKSLVRGLGIFLFLQTVIGDYTGLIGVLLDNTGFLMRQSFSREHEAEADAIGFTNLIDAGISPLGMIDFFQSLLDEQNKSRPSEPNSDKIEDSTLDLDKALSFLSSHPRTKERITTIQEKYRHWLQSGGRKHPRVEFDYEGFKRNLSETTQKSP